MNKKGQFYLIAAIIIAGIVISISYLINYSTKTVSYAAEETATELRLEGEKVMDYELHNPSTPTEEFDLFAAEYSSYANDKEIYFIVVRNGVPEAFKYTEGSKIFFNDRLNVGEDNIEFNLDGKVYSFPLEEAENFYFVVVYDKGGERYVQTG